MTNLYIDVEFNDYLGPLISMALVTEDGREWYETLTPRFPSPWVAEHIIPVLQKPPLASKLALSKSLEEWLTQFDAIHVVSDYPADIEHFCNVLIVGPGECINTPPLTMEVRRDLPGTSTTSELPHNALEDAKALCRSAVAALPR